MTTVGSKRALICSYYLPQPDVDTSSRRLLHFANFLVEDGWDVVVAARNSENIDRCGRILRQRGIAMHPFEKAHLEALLSTGTIDLALLAFWHIAEPMMNVIRRTSPRTRIVVDSMDLHFVRHARRIFNAVSHDGCCPALDANWASEMIRETNVYAAADAVLAVSQKEADFVNDLVGRPTVAYSVPICEDLPRSDVGFAERHGVVFIGNFEHAPNVDAVRYLRDEIVPRLNPEMLAEHPLYVVGSHMTPSIETEARAIPGARVVGWVPSFIPYLETARITVIPLRYGAGTKGKLIQSLMIGTPAVSTTIGIEGLRVEHENHVLVADDAASFAASMTRLLHDGDLWARLTSRGCRHINSVHGLAVARTNFLATIDASLSRLPQTLRLTETGQQHRAGFTLQHHQYHALVRGVRRTVRQTIPEDATVLVVSRGDPDLLGLGGRVAWHFPQGDGGEYAGFYPKDGTSAIEHLEALRSRGAEFLIFPSTALWWLDHYRAFSDYLGRRFQRLVSDEQTCVIFDLRERGAARSASAEPPIRSERGGIRSAHTPADRTRISRDVPRISVVIPTFNRASLLESSLESLAKQSVASDVFEVVVVDDGSTDDTAAICAKFTSSLRLKCCRIARSGISTAKNIGTLNSTAPLLFFFDDDDVADTDLLAEHLDAHNEHPDETAAVLGYTGWASSLQVTPLMHFVTDVGHYLFAYDGLGDGQTLDFTYFWGGRTSCKRSLLMTHGMFRPEFQFGSEDIELGYRLSKCGLKVVFRRTAVQYMNRAVTFDEFCRRCERQGRSQWIFSRMHEDPAVQRWCGVAGVWQKWSERKPLLTAKVERARELELKLQSSNGATADDRLRELWNCYWWTFDAFKLKGIVEASASEFAPSAGSRIAEAS